MGKAKKEKKDRRIGKRELEDLRDKLARALADYDNLTKRVEKQRQDFKKIANLELVVSLLPAIDMLENAQEHLKDSGLALTIKELEEALGAHGVQRIDSSVGTEFDEEVHEAVEVTNKGGKKDGEIVEELLAGWRFVDGPVIRPTKVIVYRKKK